MDFPITGRKRYILEEGIPSPFLKLGVQISKDLGHRPRKVMDKFRQINRFLNLLEDCFQSLIRIRRPGLLILAVSLI